MSEQDDRIAIVLKVDLGSDASVDKLDLTTRELRAELKSKVDSVDFIEKDAPVGARSGDAISVGALALAVIPSVVREIIRLIHNWCLRAERRKVEFEIKHSDYRITLVTISGDMPEEQLKKILDAVS